VNLSTYLAQQRGAARVLAMGIGVSSPFLWQCATQRRKLPPDRCPAIEQATKGEVTCEELRPDVCWVRVPDTDWPWHPAGRPLIDVTAQASDTEKAAA
jgi:DNA-binding transcriptional regulator YdaS (Cro superfamily)